MIHILRKCPTEAQIKDMLSVYGDFIKLAVDIHRRMLAGGGKMHADCEAVLLDDGSKQRNVWGADWHPFDKQVTFVSLINIRPSDGNSSSKLQDPSLRERVEDMVRGIFENDEQD